MSKTQTESGRSKRTVFNEITAHELKELVEAGKAPHILDVREADEFAAGHIPGALNVPASLLPVKIGEIDKSKAWHVICLSGGRSAMAVQYLAGMGWDVTNVAGGMSAWRGEVAR